MRFFVGMVCFLLLNSIMFAQISQNNLPAQSYEKFNERGYLSGSSFKARGNEIIGEYDGNLMLGYSVPMDLPNNLGNAITLNYNTNVDHTFYTKDAGENVIFSINSPEWIIGFNGFALQTFNFENNYFTDEDDNPLNGHSLSPMTGSQVALLLKGYHFTNLVDDEQSVSYPEIGGIGALDQRDYITLLMADGSKIVLYNSQSTVANIQDPNTLKGIYLEKGREGKGIGLVDFIDAENIFRCMHFRNGDGLTYYFEEEFSNLFGKDTLYRLDPKVMYLKNVYNQIGDTLTFSYTNTTPDISLNLLNTRKLLKNININKNKLNPTQDEVLLSMYYDFIDINQTLAHVLIDSKMRRYDLYFDVDPNSAYRQGNLADTYRAENCIKRTFIKFIVDEAGRTDTINYTTLSREYRRGGDNPNLRIQDTSPLFESVSYHNGKITEFTYTSHMNQDGYVNLFYTDIFSQADMEDKFRDPYTNFMIADRLTYDNSSLVKTEEYEYSFPVNSATIYDLQQEPRVDDIITKITTINNKSENNSPPQIIREINYSRLRNKYYDPISIKYGFSIKKMSERIYASETEKENIFTLKEYSYNFGTLSNNGGTWLQSYDGNFKMSDELVTESFGPNDQISKNTHFSYTEESMPTPESNDWKIFTTKSTKQTSQGLIEEKSYKNLLPNSISELSDLSYLYIPGLTEEEKVISQTNVIKSHVKNNFYESGDFAGKIHSKTINPGDHEIVISYDYYGPEVKSRRGFLKSEYCNDVKKYIEYPGEVLQNWGLKMALMDTVSRRTLFIDGTELNEEYEFKCSSYNNRHEYYIYGRDTLDYYYAYNNKGNLIFEVDANGYLHEFEYDEIGRIKKAIFPGSFIQESRIDTIVQTFNQDLTIDFPVIINQNGASVLSTSAATVHSVYTNDVGGEDPDGAIETLPEQGYTPEAPGGGSGGGGSTSSSNEPFSKYYFFFDQPFNCNLMQQLNSATMQIKARHKNVSDGMAAKFIIQGVTQEYSGGGNDYSTTGFVIVNFNEWSWHNVDISSIFSSAKNDSLSVHGLVIKAWVDANSSESVESWLYFANADTLPIVHVNAMTINTDETFRGGSLRFTYFDSENKAQVVKKWDHDTVDIKQVTLSEEYDAFGQPVISRATSLSGGSKIIARTDYNYLGLKNSVYDGMNRMTASSYDYLSRPLETWFTASQNPKTTMTYGKSDILDYFSKVTAEDECGKQVITYSDVHGNKRLVRKFVDAAKTQNADTKFDYNDLMQLVKVTSPENYETTYEYNELGFLKKKITPHSGTTEFKYDKFGNLRFQRNSADTSGIRFTFTRYDSLSRVIRIGTPASHILFENMDPDSLNGGESDTLTMLVIHHFDNTGFDQYPVFNAFQTTGFVFNNLKGRIAVTAYRDKVGQPWNYKAYSYDHLGRVERMKIQLAGSPNIQVIFKNEYDNFGNLVKQSVNESFYYWYEYDDFGRLEKVYSSMHDNLSTAKFEAEYDYNNADQVTGLALKGAADNESINYYYDTRGRLTLTENLSLSLLNYRFKENLIYADNSNITNQQIWYNSVSNFTNLYAGYSYDGMNRLTSVVGNHSETFTYHKDGRLLQRTINNDQEYDYSYEYLTGKLNEIEGTSGSDQSTYFYSYDNRGNIISDTKRSTSGMEYDFRNLPLTMQKGAETLKYRYDETGNRILKRAGGKTEYYVRDHSGREVGIYDKDDGWKSFNLFGNGLIGRADVYYQSVWVEDPEEGMVEVQQRFDERFYYIKDHLGSIRVTIDQTNQVTAAQDYSAYGEIWRSLNSSTPGDRYKFTEKELDIETGYSYFGARYYDSWRGTWNSVDPMEHLRAGLTPYNYCQNNPLNRFDPDGQADFPSPGELFLGAVASLSSRNAFTYNAFDPLVIYDNKTKAENAGLNHANKFSHGLSRSLVRNSGEGAFIRHAYWSLLSFRSSGLLLTKIFTDAHEYYGNNTEDKSKKDLAANFFGMMLAAKYPDLSEEQLLEIISKEAMDRNDFQRDENKSNLEPEPQKDNNQSGTEVQQ